MLVCVWTAVVLTACDQSRPHVGGRSAQEWIAALRDSSAQVRRGAVPALVQLAVESPDALASLEGALGDPDADVRAEIVEAFGQAGPGVHLHTIEPLLTVLARDPVDSIRARAAWALGRIGTGEPDAVGGLVIALRDSVATVRAQATLALGAIGTPARRALPQILAALSDPDTAVQRAAQRAIVALRGVP